MRWQDLFADLEREWEAGDAAERRAEIAERTRAEFARVPFLDRLRGSAGREVALTTRGGHEVRGLLARVGADFVLVVAARHETVVPTRAVATVSGLGDVTADEREVGPVAARLGLCSALRGLAADRAQVGVELHGGRRITGTLQRVGADFVEVAEHPPDEPPRAGRAWRRTALALDAVLMVVRRT